MYGLIGKKLTHSFSAKFFNEKFRREGIDDSYRLFPLESVDLLPSLLKAYPELKGLNVTIPYKEDVIKFLDEISLDAAKIGAVNVIKIQKKEDYKSASGSDNNFFLKGYNTDYTGFRDSLIPLLRPDITKSLILGTGGASKAVEYALKELGIESVKVSRNPDKEQISYHEINKDIMKEHLLIVNTTPLGTFPEVNEYPPIPYQYITPEHVCYDLVYNPSVTKFMSLCTEKGAVTKNGLEMLHLQALKAWDIWTS